MEVPAKAQSRDERLCGGGEEVALLGTWLEFCCCCCCCCCVWPRGVSMRISTKRRWLDVRTSVDVGSERSPSGSHWMKARADMFGGIAVAGCFLLSRGK